MTDTTVSHEGHAGIFYEGAWTCVTCLKSDLTKAEESRDLLLEAAQASRYAMGTQVQMCHERQKMFNDPNVWSRPPDWQAMTAEMYFLTAHPLGLLDTALPEVAAAK